MGSDCRRVTIVHVKNGITGGGGGGGGEGRGGLERHVPTRNISKLGRIWWVQVAS